MAMVEVDGTGGLTRQVGWLGLKVGGHLAFSLHSSDEPCLPLLRWLNVAVKQT